MVVSVWAWALIASPRVMAASMRIVVRVPGRFGDWEDMGAGMRVFSFVRSTRIGSVLTGQWFRSMPALFAQETEGETLLRAGPTETQSANYTMKKKKSAIRSIAR